LNEIDNIIFVIDSLFFLEMSSFMKINNGNVVSFTMITTYLKSRFC